MVDMHIHTTYSDGTKTVEEVLTRCEEKKLEYISITDHNTCKQYKDKSLNKGIFTGKIIKGAEMNATLDNGKGIEFLAYNIKNLEVIEEWSNKFYSYEILKEKFEKSKKKILEICDKNGLIYDINNIKKDIPVTDFFVVYMYFELIKHQENMNIMKEFLNSFNNFRRDGLDNPNSIFYMGEDKFPKPIYKDVANKIHEADGIECFHPSAEFDDRINILINYARKNNLYISGGSDFHGEKKPNNDIAVGSGSLNISKKYIDEWIDL